MSGSLYIISAPSGAGKTSLVGKFLNVGIKQKMNKLIPVFAIVLAVIFILRGLNLGIRYISPPEKMLKPHTAMMHHPQQ